MVGTGTSEGAIHLSAAAFFPLNLVVSCQFREILSLFHVKVGSFQPNSPGGVAVIFQIFI